MTSAPKNIVVLSDGTGNAAAKVWRTNVWRLFQSLDLTNPRQVAIYDDGVGSSAFKPLALLGGAVGWGLKRNVLDLYKFLCRNYEPGARIYAFGFSRGAFTIRVLLGLVSHEGLVRYESEAQLKAHALAAYRAYRKARFSSVLRIEKVFRAARDLLLGVLGRDYNSRGNIKNPPIHFVGLWDIVAAYGLPIEEMMRGMNLCGIGSCGVPRPSLGGYVTGTGATRGCPPPEGVDVAYPLNVDKSFSDVLDGLVLVDLRKTDPARLETYMGKEGVSRFLEHHGASVAASR